MQSEVNPVLRLKWANESPGTLTAKSSVACISGLTDAQLCATTGDFHFLWECLRVIFQVYWGKPSEPGTLSNLREILDRKQVDKKVKIFSTCDEFLLHAFKSHMIAAICQVLGVDNPNADIPHTPSYQWLEESAKSIVQATINVPEPSKDTVFCFCCSFLHASFLYIDLRNAIRFEDGPRIILHWQNWLVYFLGCEKQNYAVEAANLICNLKADLPKEMAYIVMHNRTVKLTGRLGQGKPLDQLNEHYNL